MFRSKAKGKFKNFVSGGERTRQMFGHGDFYESSEVYVDPVPYDLYLSNGIFRERGTGRIFKYFKAPNDVKTEWLTNPEERLENQEFFLDLSVRLSNIIESQVDNLKNDTRRRFHIHAVRGADKGIDIPESFSPAHQDYMRRVNNEFSRPEWSTYVGVEILASNVFYEANGVMEHLRRWWESKTLIQETEWLELVKDLQEVDQAFTDSDFTELDFIDDSSDLQNLTAWYSLEDARYEVPATLRTANAIEPVHGLSIITDRWGEIAFHALKFKDEISISNPIELSESEWAKPLYNPDSGVVSINIRGEIRAAKVADNLLDLKGDRAMERHDKAEQDVASDLDMSARRTLEAVIAARSAVRNNKYPIFDNTELVIGTIVPEPGRTNPVFKRLGDYGLEALLLKDRHSQALMSTLPAYPHGVLRIPKGNRKRPNLSNVLLPGLIAMSGLFRATKPAAHDGIFLGLSPAGYEFREIYTEMDAAAKYHRSPVVFCSGRPGSGKTQFLIQVASQMAYEELPVWFLNLKKTGSLKSSFDLIGGYTISMNRDFLSRSKGVLDPKFFLRNADDVAEIIAEMLFTSMRLYGATTSATDSAARRNRLTREIMERARDIRNETTYDIIFGNVNAGTDGITDLSAQEFVRNAMETSPFWAAFVSPTPNSILAKNVKSGGSFLVEWDESMTLPGAEKKVTEYTDSEVDMVNSAVTVFRYASENVANTGGGIIVDESHALKGSREARRILNTAAREWRQADIVLVLASQNISDWMGSPDKSRNSADTDDISAFVERFVFMALPTNDEDEFDWFCKITGQPEAKAMRDYLVNMGATPAEGAKGNVIPRAWVHDQIADWSGPIICGPYPERELSAGRTDKDGQAARLLNDEEQLKELEEAGRRVRGLTGKLALFEMDMEGVSDLENVPLDSL